MSSEGNFRIEKQKQLEDSEDSFISCLFHNVKCGDITIQTYDYFSSNVSYTKEPVYSSKSKNYYAERYIVINKNARIWDDSFGTPDIEDEYNVLLNGEIFLK